MIDTWYDSGAMPYAQWGYHPELGRGLERFEEYFPADFISEAIDQTRGWFYTLMAEGVLLFDSTTYRTVVCLGHLVDRDGRKMSKSLGNTVDAFEVMDRQGADALRWFLLTGGSPWSPRRVSMEMFDDVVRQFLLPLWNVYAFFVTYANASGFDPSDGDVPVERRPLLDRWVLSQLSRTEAVARDGLQAYDATGAGRRIAAFVEDLSNWYVRRARRRFWDPAGEGGDDVRAAFLTLHACLVSLSQLLAPFTPFVAETLWRNLAAGRDGAPDSVHLSDYPNADERLMDPTLDDAMAAVRQIVELGRRVRTETKMRVRQPLLEAVVHYAGDHAALEPLLDLVAEELNVKQVLFAESADQLGRWRAKPNFKVLGPRLGPGVKDAATALERDDGSLAAALAHGETVRLDVGGDADRARARRRRPRPGDDRGVGGRERWRHHRRARARTHARAAVPRVSPASWCAPCRTRGRPPVSTSATASCSVSVSTAPPWRRSGRTADGSPRETLAVDVVDGAAPGATFEQTFEIEGAAVGVSLREA